MSFLSKDKVSDEDQTIKTLRDQKIEERQRQAEKLRSLRKAIKEAEDKFAKQQRILAKQNTQQAEEQEFRTLKTKLHEQIVNVIQTVLADHQQPNSSDESISKLEKLAELRKKGILTEKEFQNKKEDLLSRI